MVDPEDLFTRLSNGCYVEELFNDISRATFRQLYLLLRENLRTLPMGIPATLVAVSDGKIEQITQRMTNVGKMALLENPGDAHELFMATLMVCAPHNDAAKIYDALIDSFRKKLGGNLVTGNASTDTHNRRVARFCFLCAALFWDYKRKGVHQGGHKFVK